MELRRRAEPQRLLVVKEEVLDQEQLEPPHIKEEPEEADVTQYPWPLVPVKSEADEEDAQSSQLHHTQTEHMETEATGEDCGGPGPGPGPEPDGNSDSDTDETSNSSDSSGLSNWKKSGGKPVRCSVCAKSFKSKFTLKTHMRIHTGVKPFCCPVCGKEFTHKSSLDYHVRWTIHTGDKPFRSKAALLNHMGTHSKPEAYTCNICSRSFKRSANLRAHKCPTKLSLFNTDGKPEKPEKHLSCSECNITFPNNYQLVTHRLMHEGKKLFTCTVCGTKRQFRSDLEIHMRIHKGKKPFSCSSCNKRYAQRRSLSQHMRIHSREKPFPTRKHQSGFTSQRNKKVSVNDGNHSSKNKDKAGPEAQTEDGAPDPSRLNHFKAEDVSVREKECNVDMKLFNSSKCRSEDDLPFKDSPTGRKPGWKFSCLFCGKDFKSGRSLTSHISVHTGEKLLSCIICQENFTLESQLLSHECMSHISSHSGEKPFRCSVCDTGCSDAKALIQHMRIHATRTQFRCTICWKEFAWRRNLEKHMEVHTKVNVSSCPHCGKKFKWLYHLKYHKCDGRLHQPEEKPPTSRSGAEDKTGNFSEPETEDNWKKSGGRSLEPDDTLNSHTGKDLSLDQENPEPPHIKEEPEPPHIKEDPEPPHIKEEQQDWSTGLDQDDPEPPHIKEEQQDWSTGLDQDDPEPPHIKEEKQEGERLQGLEEADNTKFLFTPVPVKSEDDDDEEEVQSSQLHHMEADGENCGGPGSARTSDPGSDDSVDSDFWKETREPQSRFKSLNTEEVTAKKPISCSGYGKRFDPKGNLKVQMSTQTGEKPFPCPICGKRYTRKAGMRLHLNVHSAEQRYICSVCGKGFAWFTELKYHQCVGEAAPVEAD